MNNEYLITFHTHFQALSCMRNLEKSGLVQNGSLVIKLIPVPREVSSSCGTAVKLNFKNKDVFNKNYFTQIEHDEFFRLDETGKYVTV